MIVLAWLAVPSGLNTVLIAGCILVALAVAGVMLARVRILSSPDASDNARSPMFDPVLFISALSVAALAIITYLVR